MSSKDDDQHNTIMALVYWLGKVTFGALMFLKVQPFYLRLLRAAPFYIDKITNSIEEISTGASFDTSVIPVESIDLQKVLKKLGWRFNWKSEFHFKERQLFKLIVNGDSAIQGLISLQVIENYIEMHLIETAPQNFGSSKKFAGVSGNLVAFACKMSYELGFEGFVGFKAKTQLIKHYIEVLGAELIFKDRMSISGESARKIVNSYYKFFYE